MKGLPNNQLFDIKVLNRREMAWRRTICPPLIFSKWQYSILHQCLTIMPCLVLCDLYI